jgi:hypothetical protein
MFSFGNISKYFLYLICIKYSLVNYQLINVIHMRLLLIVNDGSTNRSMDNLFILEKPSKLYFDLEYDIPANPTIDGPRLTTNFIQFVLNFMRKRSDDLDYSIKDVLVLDSTYVISQFFFIIFFFSDLQKSSVVI